MADSMDVAPRGARWFRGRVPESAGVRARRPVLRATERALEPKSEIAERTVGPTNRRDPVVASVAVHAFVWLAVGNAVGVLIAALLVWPSLGGLLGSWTYGRWVAVHLDVQLYGWAALPMVALLCFAFLPERSRLAAWVTRFALGAWSAALALGFVWALQGRSSGKLFLEWTGASRWGLGLALGVLELALLTGFVLRRRERREGRAATGLKVALLISLAAVPFVLFWSAGTEVYPAINPDSGGSTGGSLLGSSLGIVAALLLFPVLLELRPARSDADARRTLRWAAAAFVLHALGFAWLDHGDRSHYEPLQIVALSTLLVWWPLGRRLLRSFRWPAAAGPWFAALGWWSAVLLVSALVMFLPGVLDGLKFTNALVAHAHLAMAGVITSLHFVLLASMAPSSERSLVGRDPLAFWLWNGGCAAMLLALTALGVLEAGDPGRLFRPDLAATLIYGARLLAGVAMLVASVRWVGAALAAEARFAPARGKSPLQESAP